MCIRDRYKQVSYAMTSDELTVAMLQWDVNRMRVQDGNNCTCRLIYDNGDYTSKYNEFPVDGPNAIVIIVRGGNQTTPHSMLYRNE